MTPFVLRQLAELGFCGKGGANDFIADGAIELGGRLPLNPHGGQPRGGLPARHERDREAVRQVRGQAVNHVPLAEHVLVTAGADVPTSGLELGVWR